MLKTTNEKCKLIRGHVYTTKHCTEVLYVGRVKMLGKRARYTYHVFFPIYAFDTMHYVHGYNVYNPEPMLATSDVTSERTTLLTIEETEVWCRDTYNDVDPDYSKKITEFVIAFQKACLENPDMSGCEHLVVRDEILKRMSLDSVEAERNLLHDVNVAVAQQLVGDINELRVLSKTKIAVADTGKVVSENLVEHMRANVSGDIQYWNGNNTRLDLRTEISTHDVDRESTCKYAQSLTWID